VVEKMQMCASLESMLYYCVCDRLDVISSVSACEFIQRNCL